MKTEPKIDSTDKLAQSPALPQSKSRRQLLRAGVGASPVVLSVVSQPVRAAFGNGVCRSASAFASFNANILTSAAPSASCQGTGPDTWRALQAGLWPNGAKSIQGNAFSSTLPSFQITKGDGTLVDSPTIYEVIMFASGSTERGRLALAIAAAYLNVASNLVPNTVIPDAAKLQSMWTATQAAGGTFPVNAGVNWTAAQVIAWLQTTFLSD